MIYSNKINLEGNKTLYNSKYVEQVDFNAILPYYET